MNNAIHPAARRPGDRPIFRRLFLASCAAVWTASILACKGGKGDSTTIEQVGDGPAVIVALPNDAKPRATSAAPTESAEVGVSSLAQESASEVPEVSTAVDAPPEVKRFAEALTAYRRADNLVKGLTPTPAQPLPKLDPINLAEGDRGRLNCVGEILRVDDGVLVVSPITNAGYITGKFFAVSGTDTSTRATGQKLGFDNTYEAYRTAKFGVYTVVVIRKYSPPDNRDPHREAMLRLAKDKQHETDLALREARTALTQARKEVVAKAIKEAEAEANRQFPVPTAGPVQERIKAQWNFDEALPKLVRAAKEKAEARYSEPK